MGGEYTILIVDDNPSNLYLLKEYVEKFGFNAITAGGGKAALDLLEHETIDAMLLDIMMPGLNGWIVLESMKKNPRTAGIPVIMVSALDDVKNIVSCLETGADDYISKPFNPEILKARLCNSLERKRLSAEIEKYNNRLKSKVEENTRELADAYEKLKKLENAKSDFMKVISHELRTPLTGLQASAELLFENIAPGNEELIKAFRLSYERISKLVEQAILISKLDLASDIELQEGELKDIVNSGLAESEVPLLDLLKGTIPENISGKCRCDLALLSTAFKEIFNLCARYGNGEKSITVKSPGPGTIEISMKKNPEKKDFLKIFETPLGDVLKEPPTKFGAELAPLIAVRIFNIFSGSVSTSEHRNEISILIKVPAI